MVEFCSEHGIAHEVCGKVIVATHAEELPRLEELRRRGEANGLRGAVFSEGEVVGGEVGDEVALLVFHHDGFDDQLNFDRESRNVRCIGGLVLANLLCGGAARRYGGDAQNEKGKKPSHG